MDRWEKPQRYDRYRHQRESPSFSSTLLDAVYRSIDESGNGKGEEEQLIFYRETMRKKHEINHGFKDEEMTSLKRACMIEKWMEKKVSREKVPVRRKSMADFDKKSRKDLDSVLLNSRSSSSESSCGGGFSSSETESIYGVNSSRSSATSHTMQRPKPIRTSISARPEKCQRREDLHQIDTFQHDHERNYTPNQKAKPEGSFVKTKSKALKIYGDLKKVKQPMSPGGRLASFLNSLFTTGNAKKAKITTPGGSYEERKLKSEQASTCSSASSFSRSCLSKTPSSRGGNLSSNNGAKRSVRFYPVSVIVDEDCRPCGHKNIYGSDHDQKMRSTLVAAAVTTTTRNNVPTSDEELKLHVMNENRRIEEVARDLLKNYQKKKGEQFDHMSTDLCNDNTHQVCSEEEEEESDDDDIASCASSDLFELDNLSVIGIERYREELPVYETTHLGTNRAIANGLFL